VFVVGFPRSGTTLLEQMLDAHPGLQSMDENPFFNRLADPLRRHDTRILGNLDVLRQYDVDELRKQYLVQVSEKIRRRWDAQLVDKNPLNMPWLPFIHRLFPNAKYILAIRHPCDVLLSCFMSNFRLNDAMSNFLRLEDAAQFYDLTFRHWERARELFGLNVHTVVYERLVEDVEAEVRPLFDFLGLAWRDEALDHRATAKARGLITTASYAQVVEPIYKRAAGRWEGYRRHLEPILPVLRPWIEKFGYSL
jgi:hypothetical protein